MSNTLFQPLLFRLYAISVVVCACTLSFVSSQWLQSQQAVLAVFNATSPPLSNPCGVAIDGSGSVWVTDAGFGRLLKFEGLSNIATGSYTPTLHQALQVYTASQLNVTYGPWDVTVGPNGDLFVVDGGRNRVIELSAKENSGTILNTYTTSNPSMFQPYYSTLDRAGNLYVADSGRSRVVKLDANGSLLQVYTTTAPSLNVPVGVAVDSSGDVFIADGLNSRVVKLSGNGTLLTVLNVTVFQPQGMAFDSDGALYVADSGNNRVIKVDVSSNSGSGSIMLVYNTTNPSLLSPADVTFDTAGRVYIADSGNRRVVVMASSITPSSHAQRTHCSAHWQLYAFFAAVVALLCC